MMIFKTTIGAVLMAGFLCGPDATALQQPSAALAAPKLAADEKSVSPEARKGFAALWKKLPREKATSLERELTALEARAARGESVDRDLEPLRRDYPEFFTLASTMQSARWITAGGSTSAAPVAAARCTGIPFVGRNGRVRCIGALKTS